jgi:hypothetical protein
MNDKSVKQKKTSSKAATQVHLPIAEIKDSVVVLKNGGVRSVLKTSSVNFNLKSEEEQNALIYSFQGFLNTLEFPVQILIRSRKLDVDNYLDNLSAIAVKQENPLLKKQTEQYIEYIRKLVEYADIMEKNFYVIIPFDPIRARKKGMWQSFWQSIHPKDTLDSIRQRHKEFENVKKGLSTRTNLVKAGLENCNLRISELGTKELVELFYGIYNPETSRNQKLKDANSLNQLNLAPN